MFLSLKGWINDENPLHIAARTAANTGFQTPIDEVDAAARVLDPIFSGLASSREVPPPPGGATIASGVFLKDYHETEW